MKLKKTPQLLFAAMFLLVLSGCSRALSTQPPPKATPTLSFIVQNEPTLDMAGFAAQTAQASGQHSVGESTPVPEQGQPSGEESSPTPAPPEATAAGVWEPTPGRPSSYVLKPGEWPICIARRYDVNMSEFFAANGLNLNSLPGAGVTLQIPESGSWSSDHGPRSLKAHGSTHLVQAGETIYSIACSYGDIDPEGIIALNGLESPYTLSSGQTIYLP